MESISRELALKPWTYYTSYTHIRSVLKGTLARGKHPQPHCTIKPSAYEAPAYKPAEESDAGLSDAATPTSISGGVFLPFAHVGRVSLEYTGGASSSHRTPPNIGWPVQTGRTIHLDTHITRLSFSGHVNHTIYWSETSFYIIPYINIEQIWNI